MDVSDDEIGQIFRHNLQVLREEAGISQSELARRMGKTPGYVCDLERGRRSPGLRTLARLSRALGVSPATLITTASLDR